jgi:hypothetical protein
MPSLSNPRAPARAVDLDLLKTLLVCGMVGAHVIQLITLAPRPEARGFSDVINLVAFSGFMFAFGIGVGLPRSGDGEKRSLWRRLRPVLLLLLATYVSSVAFVVLVDRAPLTPALLYDLLTLTRLFGWSEFLASFFVLYLLLAVMRPWLVRIGQNPWTLVGAVGLGLASTLIVVDWPLPVLASVVGTTRFPSFPLLAYLPWFFLGIWYGTHPLRWWHFALAALATASFYYFTTTRGGFPERFPATIQWVSGSALFLLPLFRMARLVGNHVKIPSVLLMPGRHVLSFLVLSNLIIFATRYLEGRPVRGTLTAALVALAIVAAVSLLWWIVERARGRTPSAIRQPSA